MVSVARRPKQAKSKRIDRPKRGQHRIPEIRADAWANLLYESIERHFGTASHFTRDDMLSLPVLFDGVSTVTRAAKLNVLLARLIDDGRVVAKNYTNMCLRTNEAAYINEPLHRLYHDTILALIRQLRVPAVSVADLVTLWRTDSQITDSNKRNAIRKAIPTLAREGILEVADDFVYRVVRTKPSKRRTP